MTKLTDTQTILLSTASQRETGSLYPLPTTINGSGGVNRSLAALLKTGFVEEREITDASAVHRTDADLRFGLFVAAAGLVAIGIEDQPIGAGEGGSPPALTPAAAEKQAHGTKAAAVLTLLQRSDGATVAELIETTGWLPHTTRAALTGLKKKGHSVERFKRADVTCYRVVTA